jgi:hypothetical protein
MFESHALSEPPPKKQPQQVADSDDIFIELDLLIRHLGVDPLSAVQLNYTPGYFNLTKLDMIVGTDVLAFSGTDSLMLTSNAQINIVNEAIKQTVE